MSNTLNQLSPRDYLALDATAMVAAIKSGEISGPALLQAAQARCDAVNPQINAVVMRHDAHAQAVLKAQRWSVWGVGCCGRFLLPILLMSVIWSLVFPQ